MGGCNWVRLMPGTYVAYNNYEELCKTNAAKTMQELVTPN